MDEEIWKIIPEFPDYLISNYGNVYNRRRNHMMSTSRTQWGHVKISLRSDTDGERRTLSVAQLVAEAFVEPQNHRCTHVILLDGDLNNVIASNIVLRPKWYAWKYMHQLKQTHPVHYYNLPVIDVKSGKRYESIIEAGMTEGLLFDDIWRSTYTGVSIFPNVSVFEVDQ